TLNVGFDPTAASSYTGTVTLVSNAASGGTATIALSGTGQSASYSVNLSWSAPTSSTDPVAGYNVYRSSNGGSTYQVVNSAVNTPTTYTDSGVQAGASYVYYIESVDAQGNQSAPSNTWSVTIP
ncbi:MAG TPA: fibronectin type III domain-containing protein, partial [Acidobacteriaceae bacterium]|nr:fibronectin type III domain-containing protein [Acidobacteriaceae bacterium]